MLELFLLLVLSVIGGVIYLLFKLLRGFFEQLGIAIYNNTHDLSDNYSQCEINGEPIIETEIDDEVVDNENNGTLKVEIQSTKLNTSKIPEYKGDISKKFIFRPKTLEQYIGQIPAKNQIKLNIKKIKQMKAIHWLISSIKGGVGKTTLAHIIAGKLDANLIERIGGDFDDPTQIENILIEINSNPKYSILFIDEIHQLSKQNAERYFYRLMEDFTIQGIQIKPFSVIGATTDKDYIVSKMPPFIRRFQAQIELKKYTQEDLLILLKQYKKQMFSENNVPENVYDIITKNCKYTPSMAIILLEDFIVEKNIDKILEYRRIIKDGLTDIDIDIIKVLEENQKPIGEEPLAQRVGLNRGVYKTIYEPYLAEEGYIVRGRSGRTIGLKGKQLLEELK